MEADQDPKHFAPPELRGVLSNVRVASWQKTACTGEWCENFFFPVRCRDSGQIAQKRGAMRWRGFRPKVRGLGRQNRGERAYAAPSQDFFTRPAMLVKSEAAPPLFAPGTVRRPPGYRSFASLSLDFLQRRQRVP